MTKKTRRETGLRIDQKGGKKLGKEEKKRLRKGLLFLPQWEAVGGTDSHLLAKTGLSPVKSMA